MCKKWKYIIYEYMIGYAGKFPEGYMETLSNGAENWGDTENLLFVSAFLHVLKILPCECINSIIKI